MPLLPSKITSNVPMTMNLVAYHFFFLTELPILIYFLLYSNKRNKMKGNLKEIQQG